MRSAWLEAALFAGILTSGPEAHANDERVIVGTFNPVQLFPTPVLNSPRKGVVELVIVEYRAPRSGDVVLLVSMLDQTGERFEEAGSIPFQMIPAFKVDDTKRARRFVIDVPETIADKLSKIVLQLLPTENSEGAGARVVLESALFYK